MTSMRISVESMSITTRRFDRRYRLSRCNDTSKPALVATASSVRLSASLSRAGRQQRVHLDRRQRRLRQAGDLLDVGPLRRQRRREGVQVPRAERGPDRGDHVAPPGRPRPRPHAPDRRLALDRLEVELHLQLLGGEEQLLQHVAGVRQTHQQAQRELPLHHDLLDVVQDRALLGEDPGQRGGDAGAVRPGHGHRARGCFESSFSSGRLSSVWAQSERSLVPVRRGSTMITAHISPADMGVAPRAS